jgi:hypothetical protein
VWPLVSAHEKDPSADATAIDAVTLQSVINCCVNDMKNAILFFAARPEKNTEFLKDKLHVARFHSEHDAFNLSWWMT